MSLFGSMSMIVVICVVGCSPAIAGPMGALCTRLGLSDEVLAASGFTSAEADAALSRLLEDTDHRNALSSADTALESALASLAAAEQVLDSDPGNQDARGAVQAKLAAVSVAKTNVSLSIAALRQIVLQGASGSVMDRCDKILALGGVRVPAWLKVSNHSLADWRAIQAATTRERSALEHGLAVSAPDSTLLAAVRADPEVVLASQRYQANYLGVAAVFDQR